MDDKYKIGLFLSFLIIVVCIAFLPSISDTNSSEKFTLDSDDPIGGSISGMGDYFENTYVTIQATPDYGYSFSGWYFDDIQVSSSEKYSFFIKNDIQIKAIFQLNYYKISLKSNLDDCFFQYCTFLSLSVSLVIITSSPSVSTFWSWKIS